MTAAALVCTSFVAASWLLLVYVVASEIVEARRRRRRTTAYRFSTYGDLQRSGAVLAAPDGIWRCCRHCAHRTGIVHRFPCGQCKAGQ